MFFYSINIIMDNLCIGDAFASPFIFFAVFDNSFAYKNYTLSSISNMKKQKNKWYNILLKKMILETFVELYI